MNLGEKKLDDNINKFITKKILIKFGQIKKQIPCNKKTDLIVI